MNRSERLRSLALADARRLLEAHMFDARLYARQAGLAADADAFAHFFLEGGKAGLAPNIVFDSRWYLQENPDVAEAGVNPLLHYAVVGEPSGLDPSPLFDVGWYRDAYATQTPLAHYLSHRFGPFSPIPEFDAAYYLQTNPDLAEAGFDPFQHYMRFGYREFRKPSADFNPRLYANRHLAHDRDANPIADLRARRRAGDAPVETRRAPTSFDLVKQYARAGARWEAQAPGPPEEAPRAVALAFYLTQYHRIPENDAWWGEGFTEWTQLARGNPRFAGHYQPRIPGALGFYDLTQVETMREQARLARAAGLSGFVFYYYDFDGRRLLETPLENFLSAADIDIGFCLMWANENWTRRWDGADEDLLIAQTYDPAQEPKRAAEFARHFRDPRYIRLQGRPVLMIYRASLIPDTAATVRRWRRLFEDECQEEPLFVMAQCFDDVDPRPLGFDAAVEFPPHKLTRGLPEIYNRLEIFDEAFEAHAFAYDDLVEASLAEDPPDFPLIKTAVPSWDNDARRQGQGLTLVGATPLKYERWLAELVAQARPWRGERLVCINAWNEWSEGAYLEPDAHFGWAYLNATARALRGAPRRRCLLAALGAATPALAGAARRFAASFGFEVERRETPAALAVLSTNRVARGRPSLLLVDADEPLGADALQQAAAALFVDAGAKRRTLETLGLPDDARYVLGRDVLAADAPEAEALARRLFDLLLPQVAKVSVVVFGAGAGRLPSVFAQTHPVAEILALVAGSSDASFAAIDAAARAADRDVTVVLDAPVGLIPALQQAAEMASAPFLWVVGASGRSDPEALTRLIAPLQADPRVALAFCDSRTLGEVARPSWLEGSRRRAPFADATFQASDFVERYSGDGARISDVAAVVWRSEALRQALANADDWPAILRAVARRPDTRIAYVADELNFVESAPQPPA